MRPKLPLISLFGVFFNMLLSTTVLIGWFTNNGFLKAVKPGQVTMKFNTAIFPEIMIILFLVLGACCCYI